MIAGFVLIWGAGLVRLAPEPTRFVPGVQLRLVQPDVPQDEKYLPQYRYRNWQRLIALSREKDGPAADPSSSGRKRPRPSCWRARPGRWPMSPG